MFMRISKKQTNQDQNQPIVWIPFPFLPDVFAICCQLLDSEVAETQAEGNRGSSTSSKVHVSMQVWEGKKGKLRIFYGRASMWLFVWFLSLLWTHE
ncbi:hypothetical protein AKJ16_DCAP20525 [Drosera capensis]